ncbi:hypothetical protein ILYODFUR_038063, partial [Ilyodon furcidens]
MILIYQGGKHTMRQKKPRGEDKKEGSKSAQGTSPDRPPPYRPSSSCSSLTSVHTPPPGGLYPMLEVQNGTLVVHGLDFPEGGGGSFNGSSGSSAGSFQD